MRSTVEMCFAANNILPMRNWNHALVWKMADRFGERFKYENKTGNWMIKQLLNPIIAKYCDLSMFRISNNRSARHWQITIFCSTFPIIVNYDYFPAGSGEGRKCLKGFFFFKQTFDFSPERYRPLCNERLQRHASLLFLAWQHSGVTPSIKPVNQEPKSLFKFASLIEKRYPYNKVLMLGNVERGCILKST